MREPNLFQSLLEDTPEDDRAVRLWLALLFSFNSVERVLRRRLQRSFNTSLPRFDVLSALVTFPDGLSMSELAGVLGVTKGNVTGVVRRLRTDEWVDQMAEAGDRRVQRVVITTLGRKQWKKMRREYRDAIEGAFAALEPGLATSLTADLLSLQQRIERATDGETDA